MHANVFALNIHLSYMLCHLFAIFFITKMVAGTIVEKKRRRIPYFHVAATRLLNFVDLHLFLFSYKNILYQRT